MNLDFSFRDGAGRVILAGWHADPGPISLRIGTADGTLFPVTVLPRFARGDLGTDAALGVLAVAPPLPDGAVAAMLHDGDGGGTPLNPHTMAQGAQALIAASLDETFAALLRALATELAGPLAGADVTLLMDRARSSAAPLPANLPRLALATDRAIAAPGGLGFAAGWVLTDDAAASPVVGLASDGAALVPVALVAGALARTDLGGHAGRYALTGTDGYVASFRLPQGDANRPVQLLFLPRHAAHGFGLMITPASPATGAAVAGALATALRDLPADATAALMAPLALTPGPPMAPLPAAPRTGAGSVLLLIPDTEPAELRDILRWLLAQLPRPVRVIPLASSLPGAATVAMDAAMAEAGPGAGTIAAPCAPAYLPVLPLPVGTEVAAGSAAALFQLGLPPPQQADGCALVHDPLGALDPAGGVHAADLPGLPFTLRLPADLLGPALAALPRGLLSAEGSLTAAMAALSAAGRLTIARTDAATFWPGARSGAAAARLDAALCAGQAAP